MSDTAPPGPGDELRADCARCVGLCCVAPAFAASSDFAVDKPAGRPCPNLGDDFRCGIHRDLRARGFAGCTVFDCFGAGQRVAQVTFGGRDWRTTPGEATRMFDVFAVLRPLHELLWYLTQAATLTGPGPLRVELDAALAQTRRLAAGTPDQVLAVDVDAHRGRVNPLLVRVSEQVRGERAGADRRGAVLVAADLRRADLVGANLRGAVLLGADLRGVDLTLADLTGVDLRGADLRGADLRGALFVHQSQVDAARGDHRSGLPAALTRPAHWSLPVVAARRRSAGPAGRGRRR
ncbi:pentapeptide repeat-containing protein [Micromonospora carbonacea]|uniref:Pentapeptide repeat-containing protein n=1 Tax=Micromonospora carbonacea TaxID=47853 RepID=A0A7H8XNF2_9ACTN|nr:pentapeptide repeat-containing protein [Micromonospora carbonacea]QLD26098.1 pentapeptide repeat-containing protein [Micromonospora carbonacea]